MIDPTKFDTRIAALAEVLRRKLHVRGRGFAVRLRRAGRMVPKRIHRAGAIVADAQAKLRHPGLARQVDPARVSRALQEIETHLAAIDPAERRKGAILGWLGGLVASLILLAALLVALLRWQGLV